jgi:hypothetical protein
MMRFFFSGMTNLGQGSSVGRMRMSWSKGTKYKLGQDHGFGPSPFFARSR